MNCVDVLRQLSEDIAPRIKFDKDAPNKKWEYYTGGITDIYVEKILSLNKYVALLKADNMLQIFGNYWKDFLPTAHFAEPLYPKDKRM